jgi:hypothetical protein
MNFANISQITIGIISYQDYNDTVYCYQSAIRDAEIERCVDVNDRGMFLYELFPLFVFQVFVEKRNKFNNNIRD